MSVDPAGASCRYPAFRDAEVGQAGRRSGTRWQVSGARPASTTFVDPSGSEGAMPLTRLRQIAMFSARRD